jgi:hypothetical protein
MTRGSFLRLFVAALGVIGVVGLLALTAFLALSGHYVVALLSFVSIFVWIAVAHKAMDLTLERFPV